MTGPATNAFVCVENAGRRQMASAFAERAIDERGLGDRLVVVSGGTDPAEIVVVPTPERGPLG